MDFLHYLYKKNMIEIVIHGLHLVLMFAVLEPCNLDLIEDML